MSSPFVTVHVDKTKKNSLLHVYSVHLFTDMQRHISTVHAYTSLKAQSHLSKHCHSFGDTSTPLKTSPHLETSYASFYMTAKCTGNIFSSNLHTYLHTNKFI